MKLWTPVAILLAAVVLVVGARLTNQSVWPPLIAIGSVGAVGVAIFQTLFLTWWRRPIMEIGVFGSIPPYLRKIPIRDDRTGQTVDVIYPLSLQVRNTGKTIARQAVPLLTGVGQLVDGVWKVQEAWIPVTLRFWVLDELVQRAAGKSTEERDLVPLRPYVFNLGFFSTSLPDSFHLGDVLIPRNQPNEYGPGDFCFELMAFAEGAAPAKKYFWIHWKGGCSDEFDEVRRRVVVTPMDQPPWRKVNEPRRLNP